MKTGHIYQCRSCGNTALKTVVSLGQSPLANNLLSYAEESYESYPLELNYCNQCHNVQLSYVVPPEKLFNTYLYVSSTTKTIRDHFKQAAEDHVKEQGLRPGSIVVDIGSNDGVTLAPFKELGITAIGVEPAVNIAEIANNKGLETINSYFDGAVVEKILAKYGKVDLVTASNVFAHSDAIDSITSNVFKLLKEDGCFILEAQYLLNTIKDLTFDNIYHEHVTYWSVTSLNNFFNNRGYTLVKARHVDTGGGSIRVHVKRGGTEVDGSVIDFLKMEQDFGLKDEKLYDAFFERIKTVKKNINRNFRALKEKGLKIVGYGSPAKTTTSLNFFGVDTRYIEYIVEDNGLKHNKLIPGVGIPIFSKARLKEDKPNIIVIMAWNFKEEIKKNNQGLIDDGIQFISIKDMEKIL